MRAGKAAPKKLLWREGFPPPRELRNRKEVILDAARVKAAIDALGKAPDAKLPDRLVRASRAKNHILHYELWHEPDATWAAKARRDRCARIIANIVFEQFVGGIAHEMREIECIRVDGTRQWTHMHTILADPKYGDAYLEEIAALQQQALIKLEKYRAYKRGGD